MLISSLLAAPVWQVWQGYDVVKAGRKLIGATNPLESEPGTIRGDFAVEVGRNVIHGSDSPENGEREIGTQQEGGAWHQCKASAQPMKAYMILTCLKRAPGLQGQSFHLVSPRTISLIFCTCGPRSVVR